MRYPGITRVEAGRRSYRIGTHVADRRGFEAAYNREPFHCPYSHPGYVNAYRAGYRRGAQTRLAERRRRKGSLTEWLDRA